MDSIKIISSEDWIKEFLSIEDGASKVEHMMALSNKLSLEMEVDIFVKSMGAMSVDSNKKRLTQSFEKLQVLNIWDKVKNIFRQTQAKLGIVNIEVIILLMDPRSINSKVLDGIAAHTIKNKIIFYLFPYDNDEWINKLESICYHEYCHVIRNEFSERNYFNIENCLLDVLIDEGLAESVVKSYLGYNRVGKWAVENENIVKKYLPTYIKNFEQKEPEIITNFMLGNYQLGIPNWLGYSTGFYIVQNYVCENRFNNFIDYLKLPSIEFVRNLNDLLDND